MIRIPRVLSNSLAIPLLFSPGAANYAKAELPPLIPRSVLFANPARTEPRLSPDGRRLAWLAPDSKKVLQIWVKTTGKDDDRVLTDFPKTGIDEYYWTENNR